MLQKYKKNDLMAILEMVRYIFFMQILYKNVIIKNKKRMNQHEYKQLIYSFSTLCYF